MSLDECVGIGNIEKASTVLGGERELKPGFDS